MAEVTAPLALDETLQQVVSKLGNISSVAGASAYTQAVAGGYTGTQAEFEPQIAKQPIVVNPNLLDNWYFVGGGSQQGGGQLPINQKGQTSYSGSGYDIDRWRAWNAAITVTVTSDGITVANSSASFGNQWVQYLESGDTARLSGKTGTLSALIGSNLYSVTGTIGEWNPTTIPGGNLVLGNDNGGLIALSLQLSSSTTVTGIKALKLELGDTQTLAHNEGTEANPVWVLNEIPNYTEQLWRCQRYYQLFASSSYRPTYGEDYRPPMHLHSPSKGTISIGGTTYYYADANL